MQRHLGLVSLLIILACWLLYIGSLFVGGIDPTPILAQKLIHLGLLSVCLVLLAMMLSVVALVRGPQHLAAALAFALGLLYLLAVTGVIWLVLFRV